MGSRVIKRIAFGNDRAAFKLHRGYPIPKGCLKNNVVCKYWLAGRCNRYPCRFVHGSSSLTHDEYRNKHRSSSEDIPNTNSILGPKLCGDERQYPHSLSLGAGITKFAELEGHKKAITGIALPSGSDKLYSASSDGIFRIWDCKSGECCNVVDLKYKVGSLTSEGPWIFVGMLHAVQAWNTDTFAEHSLTGPVGQVYALIVGKETLFAGTQDGAIHAWKSTSEMNPFDLHASVKGHDASVVSLTVGKDMLYSGAMDFIIKVWDIGTFQCLHTLNGHSEAVTSLLCWDQYLFSSSLDGTIKVWAATGSGELEAIHTHKEEHGVLALCGIHDAEAKPVLICSCSDSWVRIYELPSFTKRRSLFTKKEARVILAGPGEMFFTGDSSGKLVVWKTLQEQKS